MSAPASRIVSPVSLAALLVMIGWTLAARGDESRPQLQLPHIGPAPDFTLTNQEGKPFALRSLRGKVAVVTFIFTSCPDTCPILTAKMVGMQTQLGPQFGSRVYFVSITVDPERDTPEILKRYANAYGANLMGWAFLTGAPDEIRNVASRYAVFYKKAESGNVDHTFLTSIVDATGTIRVQYLGVRFDPDEFMGDVESLVKEGTKK